LTHAELVARAERWLRNTRRCGVVLCEPAGAPKEQPDAIGWRGTTFHVSIAVECKVSRSDFLADARKPVRIRPGLGVGRLRYYLVPTGLVGPDEVPAGWGLLHADARCIRVAREASRWGTDQEGYGAALRAELGILLSELRKVQIVRAGGTLLPSRAASRIVTALAEELGSPPGP
jgi:hypothetical protein